MKKQNIVNLIKYHMNNNPEAFVSESVNIANEFYKSGDIEVAEYIMDLISNSNVYKPQSLHYDFAFLRKIGITKSINNGFDVSKFLFYGKPGSGKTESALLISRLLDRNAFFVNIEMVIDSKLGETSKNIVKLFNEIKRLPSDQSIVIFDELDSLVLNRINSNDLREMGRVTSTFIKELDDLNNDTVIIATTNILENFDKAIIRRFDSTISFDRYTKQDLIDVSCELLKKYIKKALNSKQDIRLFTKILNNLNSSPYPGEMKQIIRTSIAFSDENNEYDYLRRIYLALNENKKEINIKQLSEEGFTNREIEILTKVSRSSVNRIIRSN